MTLFYIGMNLLETAKKAIENKLKLSAVKEGDFYFLSVNRLEDENPIGYLLFDEDLQVKQIYCRVVN